MISLPLRLLLFIAVNIQQLRLQKLTTMGVKCIKRAWAGKVGARSVLQRSVLSQQTCVSPPQKYNCCCSSEYGEKNDHVRTKDEAPQGSSVEEKKAPKKRLGQRKEPPKAFMASFFASVEIYQTKILVRHSPTTIIEQSCKQEYRCVGI